MTVHVAALSLALWWYAEHAPPPRLAALAKPPEPAPIFVVPPPPPPPPKDEFPDATQIPPRDDSGETNGVGTANRSTPGDKPMQALRGLEQANLARDTTESRLNDLPIPSQAGAPISNDATPPSSPRFGVIQPAAIPVDKVGHPTMISMIDPTQSTSLPPGDSPQKPGVHGSPNAPKNAPMTQTPNSPSVPKELKGGAAIPGDTDSMAFANATSIQFRDGKVLARKGLKVNWVRPKWGLGAVPDAMSIVDARCVFGVSVDATGTVQDVQILHSSGSNNIDLPCQTALYSWWFEPEKDKAGHPLPHRWIVTMLF
jgi:hypothetical protein